MPAGPSPSQFRRAIAIAGAFLLVLAAPASATEPYGNLPLSFEANQGQVDARVAFLSRGAGSTLFLTRRAAVLSLKDSALRMSFAGSNARDLDATDELPGKVNSYVGDRSEWVTGAPTFGRVGYERLWPGVDAVFYGRDGKLEYDFVVAPGADPSRIALRFSGQRRARLASNGDLLLRMPGGETVRQTAPVSYQDVDGSRQAVDSRYVLGRGGRVRVELGDYDTTRRLVIDPVLVYSTFLGGTSTDQGRGIAVDSTGAAYVTGSTASTDFPTTVGAYDRVPNGGLDAFVTKLDPTGSTLVYSTYLGGTITDIGNAIAVDSAGAAYVTGATESSDFPTTAGAYDTGHNGNNDGFVTKLGATGGTLVYSTFLGGATTEEGRGIVVDPAGAAYVGGYTNSTNFPATPGAYDTSHNGGEDVFAAKLNPAGSALEYATYLGGAENDRANDIAIDASGAAYLTGIAVSTVFPTTAGAYDTTRNDPIQGDVFAVKFGSTGSTLVYSTLIGGTISETGNGIDVDAAGAAYLAGRTSSTDFPTTLGAYDTTPNGADDVFAVKLASSGSTLVYSTYIGGPGTDQANGLDVDPSGAAHLVGLARAGYPTTANAPQPTHAGGATSDAFVTKLNTSGSGLASSTFLGGTGTDQGLGIAVDPSGASYATGTTAGLGFPTTLAAYDTTASPNDAFVSKLSAEANAAGFSGARARLLRRGGVKITWRAGAGAAIVRFEVLRIRAGKRVKIRTFDGPTLGRYGRFAFTDRRGSRGDRYLIRATRDSGRRKAYGPYRAR
jgi:hypothetical protein